MPARRREILKAGLCAGPLFLPLPYAWVWATTAQEGALRLLKAPKIALVMGNGKYKSAPELRNPANDARAIGQTLAAAGFEVAIELDADRHRMLAAIGDYARKVEQKQGVGLFYFAGHGVQLAWRNFLLPTDAVIDKIDDMAGQSLDVAVLMQGLARARNPMNVIILDACRDNPFGKDFKVERKGLSQMDAPSRTLLAYATSPGNVASDGEGAHGLYTENLLREIAVPEAKIEDVFKRVRLGVRKTTDGAQIPWESTSLEEDFWFLPPSELKALSEAEERRAFEEESALWDKVKVSSAAEAFEDYLRRYPSGRFAELAQRQLDERLRRRGENRVRIVSQDGNPFTSGSAEANTAWHVGDRYVYRWTDLMGIEEGRDAAQTVTAVTDAEVHYGNGIITDLLGNVLRRAGGRVYSANQIEPVEYVVGKRWSTRYRITGPRGGSGWNTMDLRIAARESKTVPAGVFHAFRIEGRGLWELDNGRIEWTRLTKWVAPDRLRREIAMEETRERSRRQGGATFTAKSQRFELTSFTQA